MFLLYKLHFSSSSKSCIHISLIIMILFKKVFLFTLIMMQQLFCDHLPVCFLIFGQLV